MEEKRKNEDKFPCIACGLCCRHIGNIPDLAEYDNGLGTCIYLINNLCSIYDNRPDICRVDEMYTKFFSGMDKNLFYVENLKACKALQESHGMTI